MRRLLVPAAVAFALALAAVPAQAAPFTLGPDQPRLGAQSVGAGLRRPR